MLCESEMERVSEAGWVGEGVGWGAGGGLLEAVADEMQQQQQQLTDGDAADLLGLSTVHHGE